MPLPAQSQAFDQVHHKATKDTNKADANDTRRGRSALFVSFVALW
jgi:hypothetical protein